MTDDDPDVAAEIERIAGTSFDVLPEPFDKYEQAGRCDGYDTEQQPFLSAATYHFRKDESGALELVSSLPQPWLRIDISKLQRTKTGWRTATPLPGGQCMGWGSEEEQKKAQPRAPRSRQSRSDRHRAPGRARNHRRRVRSVPSNSSGGPAPGHSPPRQAPVI